MSSHHFVKEGQEPALLILDADSSDVVMSLLEWSPTVLVAAEVLSSVLSWGIKIDGIIVSEGDDRSYVDKMSVEQGSVKIIEGSVIEGYLFSALSFLINTGQRSVNVISQHPLDYLDQAEDFMDKLDLAFVNEKLKWFPISRRFEKWYPANTILTVYTSDPKQAIRVENGTFENNVITVISSGLLSIHSGERFWLAEPSS